MIKIDAYKTVQYFLLVLTIVVCFNIGQAKDPNNLFFLPYVNLISLQATIGLLILATIGKLKSYKNAISTDKKNFIKIFYIILFIYVISSPWVFNHFSDEIGDASNNILGVFALGLALATDTIANDITHLVFMKSNKRFNSRYPQYRSQKNSLFD